MFTNLAGEKALNKTQQAKNHKVMTKQEILVQVGRYGHGYLHRYLFYKIHIKTTKDQKQKGKHSNRKKKGER